MKLSSVSRSALRATRTTSLSPSASALNRFTVISRSASTTTTQPVEWEPKEVDPQLGDYPQLPALSYQRRRPGGWDDPQERRNIGEPVCPLCKNSCGSFAEVILILKLPEEQEVLSVWAYDHYPMSTSSAARQLAVAIAAFGLLFVGLAKIAPERPSIPRQYPRSGLVTELGGMEENKVRYIAIHFAEFVHLMYSYSNQGKRRVHSWR